MRASRNSRRVLTSGRQITATSPEVNGLSILVMSTSLVLIALIRFNSLLHTNKCSAPRIMSILFKFKVRDTQVIPIRCCPAPLKTCWTMDLDNIYKSSQTSKSRRESFIGAIARRKQESRNSTRQ